jgi:hypothetical protein
MSWPADQELTRCPFGQKILFTERNVVSLSGQAGRRPVFSRWRVPAGRRGTARSDEQYKGINSQWIEPDTGQRFEVQFHTRISFEAKQLTHGAYERLRSQQADKLEELVLEAFQRKVTAEVPVPPGAGGIPDYPKRGADAR